jgi:DNA-binding transcriptional ArsR family regulator
VSDPKNAASVVRRGGRKTRFGQTPEWVLVRHTKESWLYTYMDCRYGGMDEIFPGLGTIAKDLGMSYDTVERALRRLRDGGAIEVYDRYRDDGGRTTNEYVLIWDDPRQQ